MSSKKDITFYPILGTDAQILQREPTAGCMWFALDSKRIYYSDGSSFLSMGGNTGIYYGNMVLDYEPDSDQTDFNFSLLDIDGNESVTDGNYKKPNKDDLILNTPDGCFYRVVDVFGTDVNDTIIKTEKLTIAGSGTGGGTGSGGSISRLTITDAEDKNFIRYYTQDVKSAILKFNVSSTVLENNGITKIEYSMGNTITPIPVVDEEYRNFGLVELDITKYIPKMSTSTYTTVSISVWDVFGAKKTFNFMVYSLALFLSADIKNNSIISKDVQKFIYVCKPSGGTTLTNRQVIVQFYDINNNKLNNDIIEPVTLSNDNVNVDITIPEIGVFTMTVQYQGQTPDKTLVTSNILTYQVVYYDEEPQLIVNVPSMKIEQYSTLNITYMIAAKTTSINKISVRLIKNADEINREVDYNTVDSWNIYFDSTGFYDLTIEALGITRTYYNVEVVPYTGTLPAINTTGLTLNLSAINRSNAEVNKDSWVSNGYSCKFENFSWGDINGWQQDESGIDMLRLSSGAKLTVEEFRPYDIDAMETGQTIELDFKISGVTDFSAPLIKCLSRSGDVIQVGFQVTGQESTLNTNIIKATGGEIKEDDSEAGQIYNTQIQGVTAKFIENERIHLTWTIDPKIKSHPMIKTYLNGIVSGVTQYDVNDGMIDNFEDPAYIIFDSTAGNIDIYNIRVYKSSYLSRTTILNNYIATSGTVSERTALYIDNSSVIDDDSNISIEQIETENRNKNFKLSVPYIKIIGGKKLNKDDEGYYLNASDNTQYLPTAKKDYRLIKRYEFIDHSGARPNQLLESTFKDDGYLNGLVMYGQGTSSMEYPVKNLRIKAKMKDSDNNKINFKVNDCLVDLVCLKADYMESSGSHNTGTGNLVHLLTTEMKLKTPGQTYYKDKVDYDLVSAIRGFPILVFFKTEDADENAPYEFVGKYNFNLDKATHEPFGLMADPEKAPATLSDAKFGWGSNNGTNTILGTTEERPNYISPDQQPIINMVHCYEFLNNANNLANFCKNENETFEESFFKTVNTKDGPAPNWFTAYESRYPEGDAKDGSDINIGPFYRLCSWINSTSQPEATNERLESPYVGSDQIIHEYDTPQYRLSKFKTEFTDYLDFNFTAFYYVLTHVLLMIDSRAKNMMMATWDGIKWFPIFYDMDTMLGLNNYGYNKYHYDVEDTDVNIYNGKNSVLWNNFKVAFPSEIQAFYQNMQTAGLTYEKLLDTYNNKQANAVNENIYNSDSQYKYERPFSVGYWDSSGDTAKWVEPGSKDYLYASQGPRSMHRKWWLQNRINYFNGKYLSNAYKSDKYTLRLYTPSKGASYWVPYRDLTEEEFNENHPTVQYHILENETYVLATEYVAGTVYYVLQSESEDLDKSLDAVVPNNDFTLTPLYNQYLSIAFGGDNGTTTSPTFATANTDLLIPAPSGAFYNDTETYLYGGSMLKNLGDLSTQYLGQFHFPNEQTKLEILTLGNPHNDYYNPNFSSLRIGSSAPYLKTLEITNCNGLKGRSQDLSKCQNLEYIYATGTGLGGMAFPEHGILKEVRLPETITSLALIGQTQLQADKFTIGYCDYNADTKVRKYTDISSKSETGKIIKLQIDDTPINSYDLVKNNPLQRFQITGFNWEISNPDDIDKTELTVAVLEKLLKLYPIDTKKTLAQSLVGTITLNCAADALNLNVSQALAIYERYVIEDPTKPGKYFPNVNFIFDGLNIYDVNILDGNGNLHWTRKIQGGTTITESFLSNGPKGAFVTPTMRPTISHTYTFKNEWYINSIDGTLKPGSFNETTLGWPIFNDFAINDNITLIPNFEAQLQEYKIIFTDEDSFNYEKTVPYGTPILNIIPQEMPYKDDRLLALTSTYAFMGYNTNKLANTGINFTEMDKVSGPKTYYAIFKETSVYSDDNIHEEYFNFVKTSYINDPETQYNISSGYSIMPIPEKKLKGKITLPSTYNEEPIINIGAFYTCPEITHIFIKSDSKIRSIETGAFLTNGAYGKVKLKYFDFPDSLRYIGQEAFKYVPLEPNSANTYSFGNHIYYIGANAFNQACSFTTPVLVALPASLQTLKSFALSNFIGSAQITIIIGNSKEHSSLDLSTSLATSSADQYQTIRFNTQNNIVELYNSNYSSLTDTVVSSWGTLEVEKTVEEWLGSGNGTTVSLVNEGGIIQND